MNVKFVILLSSVLCLFMILNNDFSNNYKYFMVLALLFELLSHA